MLKKSLSVVLFLLSVHALFAQCYSLPTYCSPAVINDGVGTNMGLLNVKLGSTINNSTVATGGSPHYYDYTTQSVGGAAGTKIFGSVQTGTGNPTFVRIYIDWNQDGVYGTTYPELNWVAPSAAVNTVYPDTITIPVGQAGGLYRIRIQGNYALNTYGTTGIINPCVVDYGEIEEYALVVTTATPDASVMGYTSPAYFITGSNSIGFSMANLSTSTMTSVDIGYQLGTNTPVTQTLSGLNVASGAVYTASFATALSIPTLGNYSLKTWLGNVNGGGTQTPTNDTLCKTFTVYCNSALNGVYTIDPSGSGSTNYKSIGAADSAMLICGISGPVVFNIAAGTYTQQIDIPNITGASATNTITFDGGNGNAATRILTAPTTSASNFVLRFNNCNFVTVRNITIRSTGTTDAWVAHFFDGTNNRLNNCIIDISGGLSLSASNMIPVVFNGSTSAINTASSISNNNTLDSCTLNGGYYSIIASLSTNTNLLNIFRNTINDAYQYGFYSIAGSYSLRLRNNTFNMLNARTNPITSNYCMYIQSINNSGTAYFEISANKILNPGYYGIYMNSCNNSGTAWNQIYNNMFGGGFKYQNGASGIYLTSVGKTQVFHNSINMDIATTSGTAAALYVVNANGTGNDIRNNTLAVTNAAALNTYPLYIGTPTAVSNLDYNIYYNLSSSNVINVNAVNYTASNFKTAGGANSLNTIPSFVSGTNLHTTMPCNNGASLGVTTDIDGDARGTSPDIGADEMTNIPNNDIGVLKINSPVFPLIAGTQSINITLRNYGGNTITSANVRYQVNGGTPVTVAWTGSMASCDTVNYTFTTTYSFTAGSYLLKAYTDSPNGNTDVNTANDTVQNTLCPAFSGIYTINPSGSGSSNFTSFANAANAINCGGVYGPVTFNVSSGTYTEQIQLNAIQGTSPVNTVTFQSATGIPANVILTNSSTASGVSNFTLKLNGTSYCKFRNMTISASNPSYGTALAFAGTSSTDTFNNVVFNSATTTSPGSSDGAVIVSNGANVISSFMYFNACTINNGYYGSYFSSNSVVPSTENLTFNNCDFVNQYYTAMFNQQLVGLILTRNRIVTNSSFTSYIGINISWILIPTDNNRPLITGNRITGAIGGVGIQCSQMAVNSGSSLVTRRPLVANNMISMGSGANSTFGIYSLNDYWTDYIHNSVNIGTSDNSSNSAAGYFSNSSSSPITVQSNIFAGPAGAPAIRINAVANFTPVNYNDLYSTGTNLAYLSTTGYTTLATWRTATARDANSISVNPGFVSTTDLHIASTTNILSVAVNPLVIYDYDDILRCSILTDIGADHHPGINDIGIARVISPPNGIAGNGPRDIVVVLRNSGTNTVTSANVSYKDATTTKTIAWTGSMGLCDSAIITFTGANQYTFTAAWTLKFFTDSPNGVADANVANDTIQVTGCTGLAGNYTINPSGSGIYNFSNFTAAVAAMASCGVAGPVLFNVSAGSYNEQISIGLINGASATNTITFDGGTGNAATRILVYTTTAAAPHVWRFNAAKFVNVRNLTIRGNDATNSWNVNFLDAVSCKVSNCVLDNTPYGTTGSASNVHGVVLNGNATSYSTTSTLVNDCYVDSCTISTGYSNVMCYINNGNNTNYFRYNTMSNFYFYGCFFQNAQTIKFLNNTIGTRNPYATNTYTLYISSCNPGAGLFHDISNNKFSPVTYSAMYITSCSGNTTLFSVISNNMIYSPYMYPSNSWGIQMQSCNYWKVYHNSISYIQTGNYTAYGLYVSNGSAIDVRNNIFANMDVTNTVYTPCYVSPISATSFLDYNIYYNAGGPTLVSLGGVNYTAANYKAAGGGLSSLNINPTYLSASNLHIQAPCNNGANLGITKDIDGDNRGTSPDIGADEMSSLPNNDIGVMKINNPVVPYAAGTQTINVTLRNFGNNTVTSASVNYRLNGASPVTQSWTGALGACDTANFTFTTTATIPTGLNNLIVYTTSPNGNTDPNATNDTAQWTACNGMSGVYTINPSGSGTTNFTSFTAAASALACGGIYGPVTFNVAPATYAEQVSIPVVFGASAVNTVTFEGFSSATRIIAFAPVAAQPYVVRFSGCDYVTFRNLTIRSTGTAIAWNVNFLDGTNNRVSNCLIDFVGTGLTSTSSSFIGVLINGSTTSSTTATSVANNHMVDSCTITAGYYSIYSLMTTDAYKLTILNNTINNGYQYGFFSQNGPFSPRITGNTFNMRTAAAGGPTTSYGIYIVSCNNTGSNYMDISANKVYNAGQYGIMLNSCNNSGSAFNLMYNNMIGGGFRNLATTSGIYFTSVTRTLLYHNSVNMDVATTGGINAALYINAGSGNDVRNNTLSVSNPAALGAYSLYLSATSVITNLDYNNYYNRSGTSLISAGGPIYTPSNFKAAFPAGGGINSINFDPLYFSTFNLHTANACNNGFNLGVTKDIDGETRATVPDIGADEIVNIPNNDLGIMKINSPSFPLLAGSVVVNVTVRNYGNNAVTSGTINYQINGASPVSQAWTGTVAPCDTFNFTFTTPYTFSTGTYTIKAYTSSPNGTTDPLAVNDTLVTSLCTALSGTFTINPTIISSTNYLSFTSAVNALICGGVSGPVRFIVAANTYNEQITIPAIPGTTATNTVTFDGGNGNVATRLLTFPGTATIPSTVYLNSTNNIIFRNIYIQTTGTAQGWGVNFFNSSSCRINNCIVEVTTPGNSSTGTAFMGIVMSGGNTTGNYTTVSTSSDNNTIDSSTIRSGYYGVYTSINNGNFTNYFLRNTLIDQYQGGFYFNQPQTIKCNYNSISLLISNISNDAISLSAANISGATYHEISNNKIFNTGRYGIYMPSATAGSGTGLAQIYNNMIGGGFQNTAAIGIYINGSRYNIFHNTINMDAPLTSTGAAIYFASGSVNDVRNNIFAITNSAVAAAYPFYTGSTAYISTLDYNNYYNATGANLMYLAGTIKTPATYKTAWTTGGGLNSVNTVPSFVSRFDLHISNGCNNGTSVGVANDYDGETRSATPDMGADEIPSVSVDASVSTILSPTGLIVTTGTPYTVKILVRNTGSTTITNLDASFSVNNGTPVTQSFAVGTGIKAGGLVACDTTILTFTTSVVFTNPGSNFLKAYTGNVNSTTDQYHSNDTASNLFCTPFAGNFTINAKGLPSGTNFTSFTAAMAAVYSCGVSGPVVFKALPGSGPYNEQLTFNGAIPGATAVNNVTFSGGSTRETIYYNAAVAATQHTIRLNGVKHVVIDSLTINALNITNGIGVNITNVADSNFIQNCVLNIAGTTATNTAGITISTTASPTGLGNNGNKNIIQNNVIIGGYYGISAVGTSTATFCKYNQIIGNTITGVYQYGMWIQYEDTIKVNSNSVSTSNLNVSNYGMYLQYMDRFELKKNKINNVGGYGIYCATNMNYQNNAPASRSYIVNNMIGGTFYGTSGYAMYFGANSRELDIQHNSVSVYNAGTIYAFFMQQTTANQFTGLDIRNNSFVTYNGTTYAVYFYYSTGTPFNYLNNNNVWNSNLAGSTTVIGTSGYTAGGWIGVAGWNGNSKWLDPQYLNPQTNLHTLGLNLNDVGVNISTVTEDIDGDARPISPSTIVDIGADEYNRPVNDAGVVAIVSPGAPTIAGLQDVVVLIKNFGINTLTSANVFYKVGINGSIKATTWTGSLALNATSTVTFTGANQYNFLGTQVDTVISWTTLPNGVNDDNKLNDTIKLPVCKSLIGAYTINPFGSGPNNYTSFASAFTALTTCGVAGPVTLTVAPGVYTGRLILTPIPNASTINRVTFDGVDSSICKIVDATGGTAAQPAVITFNGADFITFKNFDIFSSGITIGVGVLMLNNADYNQIIKCNIRVSETSTSGNCFGVGVCGITYSTAGANGNFNQFESCAIIGGYVGASLYGPSTTANDNGNVIRNCTLTNMYQYGIWSYYEYMDSLIGNSIRLRSLGTFTTSTIGIYTTYCNGIRVERNMIYNAGQYGIYFYLTNYAGPNLATRAACNNNMIITNTTYASPITLYAYYPYNSDIYYNTVYCGNIGTTSSYAAQIYYPSNTDVRNNIFYNPNTVSAYALANVTSTFNTFDNNIIYCASSGTYVIWNNVAVPDLVGLKAYAPTYHQKSYSIIPNFVSTALLAEDLHLTSNVPGMPADRTANVPVDFDNDPRCPFAPTIGADESKFNSGNPTASFSLPDTIFVNSAATFLNNNLSNLPLGHRWYVNGVLVGSNLNLQYTFTSTGTYSVKLFTYGCVGTDSITKTVTVYNPTQKPIADFIADIYSVETYQPVQFTDLSTKGPVFWYWTFTPSAGINYNNGTNNNSKNPVVNFSIPGVYQVCLWDSNAIGRSATICKTAYIQVKATTQMCIFPFDTKEASGILYDDGGPNGNYSLGTPCNFLIDPCASSINIKFSQFVLAGSAYIRIYNGKDNQAPPLHPGLGFTGTVIPGGAAGITASSGKMYIEFIKGGTIAAGFTANWTSVASTSPPPTGRLDIPDTAYDCGAMTKLSYIPSSLNFDKDGAVYSWYFDYVNSPFPDITAKGLYAQDWSYGSTGQYIIRCDIIGCGGTETLYDTIEIVHPNKGPIVDFKADILVASLADVVTFTDLSKIDPIWWQWTFSGPGTVNSVTGTSGSKNYGVQFTVPGIYTVTLKDSNCVASNSLTKVAYIKVVDYCIPMVANTSNTDFSIERFTLGRVDTIIQATVYGLDYTNTNPTVGTVSYRDNTNKLTKYVINNVTISNIPVMAWMGVGESYDFNVKRLSNFNRTNFKIWVDFNQDGVFQTNELAASSGITTGINYSGTITVPLTAKLGYTRLRIGTNFDSLSNTPCGINAFGDFNDYRVNITTDITPPVIYVPGNVDTIYVEVGRLFVDPGITVTGATTITHSGVAFNTVIGTYPSLGVHTVTATDGSNNTTIRNLYIRATPDVTKPVISRNGADTVYQEANTVYTDLGATATDFYFGSITGSIITTSTVNINKLGTYKVTYNVTDAAGNAAVPVIRTVIVRDTQIPVITVAGSNPLYVNVHTTFNLPAATVTDNYNNGLTYTVSGGPVNINLLGSYQLFYDAKDSSGNIASTVILTVIVRDVTPPKLTLLPPDTMILDCITLTTIPEPGYFVSDDYYPSNQITISKTGTVNLNQIGIYIIRYYATDPSGNVDSSRTRIYKVIDREAPVITLLGNISVNWPRWKPWVDPGTSVYDKCDPTAVVVRDESRLNIYLPGLYEVSYSCTDASGNAALVKRRYVNIYTPMGINNNGNNNLFNVYPNPNNGLLNVDLNIENVTGANIMVFDANGKVVYTSSNVNPVNNKIQINLSNEAEGIYFIKVVSDKFSASRSFSIVK